MKKILFSLLILVLISSCEREIPTPASNPTAPDLPSTPTGLEVEVGDKELELNWNYGDTTNIAWYRIYNTDSSDGTYELIDSSQTRSYLADDLRNAQYYYYKVSAVNTSGVESRLSEAAYGSPNLFEIIINDGLETTSTRVVTLTMVVPTSTSLMKIANDSLFTESTWESYSSSKSWVLTEDTGEKTVYAMFRDEDGNTSLGLVTDDIIYEIADYDYSISVNDDAEETYTRDVEIEISAPDGTTWIMISHTDDFTNAIWEEYDSSRDWYIRKSVAENGDTVRFYATFRDANSDSVAIVVNDLIVLANSDPVDLYPVYQPTDSYETVDLSWSVSNSGDFDSYRVFRSLGLTTADTMVTTIYDISETSYEDELDIDEILDDNPITVSYKVRFYSIYDDSSDSEVINISLINYQPPAVNSFIHDITYTLDTLTNIDLSATFGWQRSDIVDFEAYVVYENTTLNSASADPVYYSYDQSDLSYSISKVNVDTTRVYYYWVKVNDLGGRESDFSAPDSVYY